MSNVLEGVGHEPPRGLVIQHLLEAYANGGYTNVAQLWVQLSSSLHPSDLRATPKVVEAIGWSLALTKQWDAFNAFRGWIRLLEAEPHFAHLLTALDAWQAIHEARYDAALLMVRAIRNEASEHSLDIRNLGHALKVEGVALFRLGQYDRAERAMRRALDLFEVTRDAMQVSHCATNLGLILNARGAIRQAREELLNAHQVLVNHQAAEERIALASSNLAIMEVHLGNIETATTLYQTALATFGKLGLRSEQIAALNGLGHCARMRGYFDKAKQLYSQALKLAGSDLVRKSGLAYEFLGQIHFDLGDFAEAERCYQRSMDIAASIAPDADLMVETCWRFGELLAVVGRTTEARELIERAEILCEKAADRRELGCVQRARARLYVALNDETEATEWFEKSVATLQDTGRVFELALTQLAFGGAVAWQQATMIRSALETFKQLNYRGHWVDRARGLTPKTQVNRLSEEFGFVTEDGDTLDLLTRLVEAAPTPYPILIGGESGTGKELLARGIHRLGGFKGDFIALNCAALPKELFESELFGHQRGAFSGAQNEKMGLFEAAHDGVLLLDEIGEMPLDLQAKLLRVLEEQSIRRVGETHERRIQVKVVAATNRPLEEAVRCGTFRSDLYHRLAVHMADIKPLRQRSGDLAVLTRHFIHKEKLTGRLELTPALLTQLKRGAWPGNVRELRNELIRRAYATRPVDEGMAPQSTSERAGDDPCKSLKLQRLDLDRQVIEAALVETLGNVTAAARHLGMHVTTLRRKMRHLEVRRT